MDTRKYSKTKVILHPLKGLVMEIYASPFIRFAVGASLLMLSFGAMVFMLASALK
ncbi:hypothetical protein L1281_002280 [Neisseria sp. HSC-16F19]|nr:hypothetical protein [Neisseria sp. HSC-16F19]MCP2041669.1 hypothetical protein [Neisseria sp. HSC-16F19]